MALRIICKVCAPLDTKADGVRRGQEQNQRRPRRFIPVPSLERTDRRIQEPSSRSGAVRTDLEPRRVAPVNPDANDA